jgi:hypothetical protein
MQFLPSHGKWLGDHILDAMIRATHFTEFHTVTRKASIHINALWLEFSPVEI